MIFIIIALLTVFPLSLEANTDIDAASYLLIEADSLQVISGRNYHTPMAPASTTKVMTAIIAMERLDGNEMVIPDSHVLAIPASKLSLKPGKRYKAIDLIKGLLIKSANDAAYALAVHIGENEQNFAKMMNDKAKVLGAFNTQFKNASGLYVEDQYTTCYDLALIFRYALTNDKFRQIAATKYFNFSEGMDFVTYKNHNRLLFCFEPTIAGKTGFTRKSRHCYVGAFEKDGRVYILSILGSNDLWGDAVQILGILFNKLPTAGEIKLARANSVMFAAYREKKEKPVLKKKTKKSKQKKMRIALKRQR
ncbi:MAG: serine hydrolase [Syntrophorhabdaceae bacterium]|nr:serine hydrolase [Syntrophorhabdaceae bacterium]